MTIGKRRRQLTCIAAAKLTDDALISTTNSDDTGGFGICRYAAALLHASSRCTATSPYGTPNFTSYRELGMADASSITGILMPRRQSAKYRRTGVRRHTDLTTMPHAIWRDFD